MCVGKGNKMRWKRRTRDEQDKRQEARQGEKPEAQSKEAVQRTTPKNSTKLPE